MSEHGDDHQAAPRPDLTQEAAKFLDRDFNQCFTQLRHYDAQLWDICKFAFTGYSAVLALSVGLFEYSRDHDANLVPSAMALLLVSLLLGLFLFALAVRNRVYFVFVTRYINEHRQFFLSAKPFGFSNSSGMYTNPKQPPFFNWRSSQAWLCYIVASLNAVLGGSVVRMGVRARADVWVLTASTFAAMFVVQVWLAVWYLNTRENKGASKAVFGRD